MSIHIVIDGYNLIRQSKRLRAIERSSLQEGREALLDGLSAYRRVKHYPMTVVFDGIHADNLMQGRTRHKGINVLFSRAGESADAVIKRLVYREAERAVVVTSDREIADFSARQGAATIGSVEFEEKMKRAAHGALTAAESNEDEEGGWMPTTKKKGPSHRPPKRQRKSRVRTRKL
ncbi:MAG: NYN domain-containing protein [Thermodesulfobacteriota bacterium]|nr:NYN domain-containing protein [Thermodesulfobacteriota bacterium]